MLKCSQLNVSLCATYIGQISKYYQNNIFDLYLTSRRQPTIIYLRLPLVINDIAAIYMWLPVAIDGFWR